jgi:hypothetical protein
LIARRHSGRGCGKAWLLRWLRELLCAQRSLLNLLTLRSSLLNFHASLLNLHTRLLCLRTNLFGLQRSLLNLHTRLLPLFALRTSLGNSLHTSLFGLHSVLHGGSVVVCPAAAIPIAQSRLIARRVGIPTSLRFSHARLPR